MGSKKLVSSHTSYNDAVQLTVAREVLTNIVRSRYSDPMQFMAVSAINAQFSVSMGASAGAGGIGQAGAAGDLGASIGYSDSPTITYTPLSDAGFYKSFFGAFEVGEAVGFGLAYRFARTDPGWQTLKLWFSFASINDANDFDAGRANPLYKQRVDAFVHILGAGGTLRQIPEWDFDTTTIAKDKVTAEDMVRAFAMGMNFVEEDDGENLRLARYRLVLALVVPGLDDPQVAAALEDLGVTPGRSQYVLRPPAHSSPGESDSSSIWVTPRSMADAVGLATRFVEVPAEHEGIVSSLEPLPWASPAMSSIRIRSSKDRPPFPYHIQHRGYWFYIDDTEINSKVFFDAMVAAYSSRVGSKSAQEEGPPVVLAVGG